MLVVGGKLGWRIDKDLAGGGASVDAASHLSVVEADIQVALEHHKYAFDPGGADRGILVCR